MSNRQKMNDFIPMDQCEHGHLYYIKARNFRLGIYNEVQKEFIGIRTKFGGRFITGEDHWDTGAPHGTVKPIAKLEKSPFFDKLAREERDPLTSTAIFDWLDAKASEYRRETHPHEAPGHS